MRPETQSEDVSSRINPAVLVVLHIHSFQGYGLVTVTLTVIMTFKA